MQSRPEGDQAVNTCRARTLLSGSSTEVGVNVYLRRMWLAYLCGDATNESCRPPSQPEIRHVRTTSSTIVQSCAFFAEGKVAVESSGFRDDSRAADAPSTHGEDWAMAAVLINTINRLAFEDGNHLPPKSEKIPFEMILTN